MPMGVDESILAQHHATDIDGCEAIDVLVGRDGVDDLLLVDVLGEGELDDEAVNLLVVVEEMDGLEELLLGGGLRHAVDRRGEAHLVGGLLLVGDVRLAGAVGAYDDCCQMGRTHAFGGQLPHLVGYLFLDLQGQGLAV